MSANSATKPESYKPKMSPAKQKKISHRKERHSARDFLRQLTVGKLDLENDGELA